MNMQQLKNAIAIIKQIKNDEWEFEGWYMYDFKPKFTCATATRKGVELWLANGALFCGVKDKPHELGVFGCLVWWFGAGKKAKKLEKKMYRKTTDLTR